MQRPPKDYSGLFYGYFIGLAESGRNSCSGDLFVCNNLNVICLSALELLNGTRGFCCCLNGLEAAVLLGAVINGLARCAGNLVPLEGHALFSGLNALNRGSRGLCCGEQRP